jgi:hypothetical protein
MFTITKFTKQIAAFLCVQPFIFRLSLDAVRLCPRARRMIAMDDFDEDDRSLFQEWCRTNDKVLKELQVKDEIVQKHNAVLLKLQEENVILQMHGANLEDLRRERSKRAALGAFPTLDAVAEARRDLSKAQDQFDKIWKEALENGQFGPDPENDEKIIEEIMRMHVGNIKYAGRKLLSRKDFTVAPFLRAIQRQHFVEPLFSEEPPLFRILEATCRDKAQAQVELWCPDSNGYRPGFNVWDPDTSKIKIVVETPLCTETINCLKEFLEDRVRPHRLTYGHFARSLFGKAVDVYLKGEIERLEGAAQMARQVNRSSASSWLPWFDSWCTNLTARTIRCRQQDANDGAALRPTAINTDRFDEVLRFDEVPQIA